MDRQAAEEIIEKMNNCRDRIIDTHYCEVMSCEDCEYHVSEELKEQAIAIIKESEVEEDNRPMEEVLHDFLMNE